MQALCYALLFAALWTISETAQSGEIYSFDMTETEKKPYHFGGYVEFKPMLFGLDHDAALYNLRFYDNPRRKTMPEWI